MLEDKSGPGGLGREWRNQARKKSAMTISGGRTFRPGRLFRIQGRQDDRAVSLQPLREHLIVRACSGSVECKEEICRDNKAVRRVRVDAYG
jgi:hypothetical protein